MSSYTRYTHYMDIADIDASMHLRLPDLLNYILHASAQGEDELGTDVDMMRRAYNAGWVLMRVTMQMDDLPQYQDTLVIHTWPTNVAHNMVFRAYEMYTERAGESRLIGVATGIWTLIDLQTREISTLPFADRYIWSAHHGEQTFSLSRLPMPERIEKPTFTLTHHIHYTDLDLNNHCNSAKYLQFMLNTCDMLAGIAPVQIDVRYAHELGKDDVVTVEAETDADKVNYLLRTADGRLCCSAVIRTQTDNK